MDKATDAPSTPGAEIDDLREYISRLESRTVWAENEVQKLLAARSLRLARAFGTLRKAPFSVKSWASFPGVLMQALRPASPELKNIERRRFEALHNMGFLGGPMAGGEAYRPMPPKTAIGGFYQNSAFVLEQHDKIAGLAAAEDIKNINPSAEFFGVRPDDYDYVLKKSKATAFVLDLDYVETSNPYWGGIMSMTNVPISVTAAQCLQTARELGMALYLFSPQEPHRYPLLGDVKPLFHSEIAYS